MSPNLKLAASELTARNEPVTPPNLAAQLNRDFLSHNLGDIDGPSWKDRLKREYTDPLTTIGGQQDETVGDCRWVVKALRQKAGIMMVTEPAMAPIATGRDPATAPRRCSAAARRMKGRDTENCC